MLFISAEVSDASSTLVARGRMCPWSRSIGWLPTVRCRSLALWVQTVWSSLSMSSVPIAGSNLPRQLGGDRPRISPTHPLDRRGPLTLSHEPAVHRDDEEAFRFR